MCKPPDEPASESPFLALESLDKSFEGIQAYDERLENSSFIRCSFQSVGLKNSKWLACKLERCRFSDAYLRNAAFERCDLSGTEFWRTNLAHASFSNCRLWYVEFRECELNYSNLLSNLPTEINLRRKLLRSMRLNAVSVGEDRVASQLFLREIEAETEELWATFAGSSSYFRANFSAYARADALRKWVIHKSQDIVWGFGLRPMALVRSTVVVLLLFTFLTRQLPALFTHALTVADGPRKLDWFEALYVTIVNFSTLGLGDYPPANVTAKLLCMSEGFIGAIFLGLVAATAYRAISRQ